ncbi:MAG: type I-C CRISPR-associated protein Cas8c/Csd1 [Eubacteriales bacterium]|nr:type I-C CRISPR-associated protein Cas8c/Csd1 [Eubacteriales bacterium]
MGLLQQAALTYDCHSSLVGQVREGHEMLAPVSHLVTRADIEITLDRDGQFVSARKRDKTEPKIVIPATEGSAGRTAKAVPHPLCDQLKYIAPYDGPKYAAYLAQLTQWTQSDYSHPKLGPILAYVRGGTILNDLAKADLIQLNSKGIPSEEKLMVCWRILNANKGQKDACWLDRTLFQSFIDFYASMQAHREKRLCMVSGELSAPAGQHPKGLVPINGNAKLISANDSQGFTFRGRFTEDAQAATVSYDISQKAHCALRWLIAEQRVFFGGRVFLCWNPQGKRVKSPSAVFLPFDCAPSFTPSDYRHQLQSTLFSFRQDNCLTGNETVVLAAFDAATTGRLALTWYAEHRIDVFLQRLHDWDAACNWENGKFGIQSPSLPQIINNAFGTQREERGKAQMQTDDRVCRQQMQRLMDYKLNAGQRIPSDIVRALTLRASQPQAYDRSVWLNLLFTACAVIKKYRHDQYGEEWTVPLDAKNKNRSYLFGRLLAIAEKVERDTYNSDENREPNAIRMQTVFSRRPLYAWRILEERLIPYYRQLSPGSRQYYKRLTGEIVTALTQSGEALDRPLEDVYLLGYYSQRQNFYKKNHNTEE